MAETLAVFQKAASLSIAMPMTARRRTVEALAIFGQRVDDQDLIGMTFAEGAPVFSGDVVAEGLLSLCAVSLTRASAELESSVLDDPDGAAVSASGVEVEAGRFCRTRHAHILPISASVVKVFRRCA
jgi:hypothetical protein